MLTGQAKEKFEGWMVKDYPVQDVGWKWFIALHPSLQFGVYQDWADSLGYDLNCGEHANAFMFLITHKNGTWVDGFDHETRQEARNAAIEKLNELINEG